MANKSTNRTINVYVNDKDAGKTMKQLAKEAAKLNNTIKRDLIPGTDEYNDAVKRLGELRATLRNHRQNIQSAADAYSKARRAAESFMEKVGKRAFWAAIIASVGAFVNKLVTGTYEVIKLRGEIKRLTSLSGRELRKVTAGVAAIANTFEESNDKVAIAVKRLMDYGLTGQEALDLIEKGFLSGADASGEFLDNIDEYTTQFQGLNYTANEFVEILTKQAQTTYKDFGADFLKEFGVLFTTEKDKLITRLNDVNQNVEQLFTQDLVSSIQEGELGAKASMNAIITEIEKLPPNSEKARAAINQIFGTKGEDNSEEFIRSLNDVTGNIDRLIDRTDALTIAQQNQLNLQKNINTLKQRFASVVEKNVLPAFANMVGLATEYIQTPLSEELEQEQVELNALVTRITDANISQENRNKLIQELQTNYPFFLDNIDAETVSNEDLAKRLSAVNEMYINKIILQKEDEKIQKQAEKIADARTKKGYELKKIEELVAKGNQVLGNSLDFTNTTLAERIKLVSQALEADAKWTYINNGLNNTQKIAGNDQAKILKDLTFLSIQKSKAIRAENKAIEQGIELDNDRAALIKALNINEQDVNDFFTKRAESASKGNSEYITTEKEGVAATKDATQKLKAEQEQRQKDLQNHIAQLKQLIAQYKEEEYLASLSQDERDEARIRLKYDKQIELVKEYEQKYPEQAKFFNQKAIELRKLRDQELLKLQQTNLDKQLDAKVAQWDKEAELETKKAYDDALRKQELEDQIQKVTMDSNALALAELDAYYNQLLAQAELYEIDTTALKAKYAKERAALQRKSLEDEQASQLANYQVIGSAFGSFANTMGSLYDQMEGDQKGLLIAQKGFTLAQIAIDTASAISSLTKMSAANPLNVPTGGLAGFAQYATGIVRILANIAQARAVLADAQFYQGGYYNAVGPQDGRRYRAQYIGQPQSGMLPPGPKLILANELGPEYFVNHQDMQIPEVANYVGMIEAIRVGRQRQNGGFSETTAPASNASPSTFVSKEEATMLLVAIQRLNENLENGLFVLFENETVIELKRRILELTEIEG